MPAYGNAVWGNSMRVIMKTDLGTSKQNQRFKGSVSRTNTAPALHLHTVMIFFAGDHLKERLGVEVITKTSTVKLFYK